jgi:hypothetical protein
VVPKHEIRKEEKMKISEIMEVGNPYAVGMAQAMKSTGDTPPLKKSTIKKAHEIAKAIDENASDEEEDEFHRKLDQLVHKTFGHSSDEVEEAYTQSAAPGAQLKGNEKAPKAKAGRTDHPHGGRLVGETTSAGAVAAVATPIGTIRKRNQDEVDETTSASGVSVGAPKGKPRNNTGKNALNSKDNLLGEKSRKVRRTKR